MSKMNWLLAGAPLFILLFFQNCSMHSIGLLIGKTSPFAQAFDVGGLVSDGHGGYSDTGFGGVSGSGDLGLSDGDLGGGFGVSANSSADSGGVVGDAFGGDEGAGETNGGGIADAGIAASPATSEAIESQIDAISDQLSRDTAISQTQREAISKETEAKVETALSEKSISQAKSFNALTDKMESMIMSFLGNYVRGEKVDLSARNIHSDSKQIVKNLWQAYNSSPLTSPLTDLGKKGIRVRILSQLSSSVYEKYSDTIYLSKKDVDKYGLAVLYHELLHAGLEKAILADVISEKQYNKLSELNIRVFSHLNGFVGTFRGQFKKNHFGYQEAFVVGWSWVMINSNASKLMASSNPLLRKMVNYRDDITNNRYIKTLKGNRGLWMIDTSRPSPNQVKKLYLNYFLKSTNHHTRETVDRVNGQLARAMPDLCRPGRYRILKQQGCNTAEAIYQNSQRKLFQVCGYDYQYGPETWTSCGRVRQYLGR